MDSVIFSDPLLIVLYGIAMIFAVTGLKNKKGILLPSVSIVIAILTSGYSLLLGATLYEVALVLLCFLAVNLVVYTKRGEK